MLTITKGTDFLVNSYTANSQGNQGGLGVTALKNGGFVVTWNTDEIAFPGGDGSGKSVKAQIYNPRGVKVGGEFLVNTTTQSEQAVPAIAALADGGFVVAWGDNSLLGGDSSAYGIKAQRYNSGGEAVGGEFLVNTVTSGFQIEVSVTGLSNGGFLITWRDESLIGGDASGSAVKAQLYGASGNRVGGEFLVNASTVGYQYDPSTTALSNGGFVVTWSEDPDSSIRAQMYDYYGARVGGELVVNTNNVNSQSSSVVAGLAGGGYVVAWVDASGVGGDSSASGIKFQRFDALGNKVGGETRANTTTSGTQDSPSVTALSSGGFLLSWSDWSGAAPEGGTLAVRAQAFDAQGAPVGAEFLVNSTTAGTQSLPSSATLNDGSVVVAFLDGSLTPPDTSGPGIRANIIEFRSEARSDVTGDGVSDVLWQHTSGAVGYWAMNGGQFAGFKPLGQITDGTSNTIFIAEDGRFGGSASELLVRNKLTGEVGLWTAGGQHQALPTVDLNWVIQGRSGTSDFNGDGTDDVLWRDSATGQVVYWFMQDNQLANLRVSNVVGPEWQIVGTGDFNGNGRDDVLWRSSATNETVYWNLNADGSHSIVLLAPVDPQWKIQGTGDFDGNGREDVLWRNSNTGETGYWRMDAGGSFTYTPFAGGAGIEAQWSIKDIGDYNGDGREDIWWQNADGQHLLWQTDPSVANGYLRQEVPNIDPFGGWSII